MSLVGQMLDHVLDHIILDLVTIKLHQTKKNNFTIEVFL